MKQIKMVGVDLSHWNRVTDWNKLASEIDFVMLKFGGEEGKPGVINLDPKFEEYYQHAKEVGLHVGCYFFASNKLAVLENDPIIVDSLAKRLTHYEFDMPVALDWENQDEAIVRTNTDYVQAWCRQMEDRGYYVSIYGSDISSFKDTLILDRLTAFDKWVARYNTSGPQYVTKYGMWQKSSTMSLPGISGNVDYNYAYIDYPTVIKKAHLNGF